MDSNHRPQGYEPCELPTALPRDFILQTYEKNLNYTNILIKKLTLLRN